MLYFLIPLCPTKSNATFQKIFLIYCVINEFLNFYPVSLLFFCLYLCLDSHTLFCVTFISPHLLPYLLILHLLSIITHPTMKIIMQHETSCWSPLPTINRCISQTQIGLQFTYFVLSLTEKKEGKGGGTLTHSKHEIFHIFIIRILMQSSQDYTYTEWLNHFEN